MAPVDFDALAEPLADDDPCGSDLDLDGDDDFLNYLAAAEGELPSSFFEDGQPFDRSRIDFEHQFSQIAQLSERTRDLRLVTLLARFLVLQNDLAGFARALEIATGLLERFWDEVHPRAEGGAHAMRAAAVGTLNVPTVIFPLQYIRLCDSRRTGPITYRAYMFATGDAKPREGEETPGAATILQALRDAEDETLEARGHLDAILGSIGRIATVWAAHGDIMESPPLDGLAAICGKIVALIDTAIPREGAGAPADSTVAAGAPAAGPAAAGAAPARGAIATAADARQALSVAADYFRRCEPSSPVLPLAAQAEHLLGRSFIEAMQILLPNQFSEAAFRIGGQQYFPLPVERLSDTMPQVEAADDAEAAPDQPRFAAASRGQAMALLDEVAAYLRHAEPASPVPWLIERARALAERDFLSVLRAVLPSSSLHELDTDS